MIGSVLSILHALFPLAFITTLLGINRHVLFLPPFYRWRNWCSRTLSTLPKVKIVIKGASIKTKLSLTPQVMLHPYVSRTRTQSIIFSPGSDLSKSWVDLSFLIQATGIFHYSSSWGRCCRCCPWVGLVQLTLQSSHSPNLEQHSLGLWLSDRHSEW